MTDIQQIFILGPLYFFPLLLEMGSMESIDPVIFLTSGLGTLFWVAIASAIVGIFR